jgi:hypothetical protein
MDKGTFEVASSCCFCKTSCLFLVVSLLINRLVFQLDALFAGFASRSHMSLGRDSIECNMIRGARLKMFRVGGGQSASPRELVPKRDSDARLSHQTAAPPICRLAEQTVRLTTLGLASSPSPLISPPPEPLDVNTQIYTTTNLEREETGVVIKAAFS